MFRARAPPIDVHTGGLCCKSIDLDDTRRVNRDVHSADGEFHRAYRILLNLMLLVRAKAKGLAVLK